VKLLTGALSEAEPAGGLSFLSHYRAGADNPNPVFLIRVNDYL
jgi:hypothetical protein